MTFFNTNFDEDELGKDFDKQFLENIKSAIKFDIVPIRCIVHNKCARIRLIAKPRSNISFNVSSCCDNMTGFIEKKLYDLF